MEVPDGILSTSWRDLPKLQRSGAKLSSNAIQTSQAALFLPILVRVKKADLMARNGKAQVHCVATPQVKMLIGLLKNAEANAESKNLDTDKLVITHIAVNRQACVGYELEENTLLFPSVCRPCTTTE